MAARVRDVAWAESARDALDEVIEHIAQDSQPAAIEVLEEALRAASSLAAFAARGRIVPELNDPTVREVFVFRYRLLYEVGDDRVAGGGVSSWGARLCDLAAEPETAVARYAG